MASTGVLLEMPTADGMKFETVVSRTATKLFLGGKQIQVLPPEIGELTNLTSIDLHDNQLTVLPPEIGNLVNLKELFLARNPFEDKRLRKLAAAGSWFNAAKIVLSLFHPVGPPPSAPAFFPPPFTATAASAPPLASMGDRRAAFEAAVERSETLQKQAARAQKKLEEASYASEAARRRAEEMRRSLLDAQRDAEVAERRKEEAEEQCRRLQVQAYAAERAVARAREEMSSAGSRAEELAQILGRRNLSALSVSDVCDVLRELHLSKHVASFERQRIDGSVLGALDTEKFAKIGVTNVGERLKLRRAMRMVETCGLLRLAPEVLERIAARARTTPERNAVLIAGWDAGCVCEWLSAQQVPQSVRERLLAANITGELLLHLDDGELELLGVSALGDRVKLLRPVEAACKSHFDALRAFFGTAPAPPATQQMPHPAPAVDAGGVPGLFVCPISLEVMEWPVVAADGFTYERAAIEQWLRTQASRGQPTTSPMTNAPLAEGHLVPNNALRSEILAWREKHPH